MNYRYSNGRIFFLRYKYHFPFSEAMASFKWVSILWKLYRNMVFRQPWPYVFPLLGSEADVVWEPPLKKKIILFYLE